MSLQKITNNVTQHVIMLYKHGHLIFAKNERSRHEYTNNIFSESRNTISVYF